MERKTQNLKTQIRRAKTVDDLFVRQDINAVFEEPLGLANKIKRVIVIYQTEDEFVHVRQNPMEYLTEVGLLEYAKPLISEDDE